MNRYPGDLCRCGMALIWKRDSPEEKPRLVCCDCKACEEDCYCGKA